MGKEAKGGKVNCERYKQLCSQAEVTGYPTVRIYNRATDFLDFELVRKREVADIVNLVQDLLREGEVVEEEKKKRKTEEKEAIEEAKNLRDDCDPLWSFLLAVDLSQLLLLLLKCNQN